MNYNLTMLVSNMMTVKPTYLFALAAITLSACSDREAADAAQTSAPLPVLSGAGFQAACANAITAKMPDPSAADIAFETLAEEEGYRAIVTLRTGGGTGSLTFEYTCLRGPGGDIVTTQISE